VAASLVRGDGAASAVDGIVVCLRGTLAESSDTFPALEFTGAAGWRRVPNGG
jgi:hypothetical protein